MQRSMINQLKIEGLGLFVLFTSLYLYGGYEWKYFFILFFTPDLSFLGYLISPKVGGWCYNLLHNQSLFAVLLAVGLYFHFDALSILCITYLAHSNFDRVWGYGLKDLSSFNLTHLGTIGKSKA